MSTQRKGIVVSCLVVFGIVVTTQTRADERSEMGRMTASQMRGNYQRIETWKGNASVLDRHRVGSQIATPERLGSDSGTCLFKSIADVEFAVDVKSDSLFCSYSRATDGEFELPNGKRVAAEGTTFYQESIITPEHYIRSDPEASEPSSLRGKFNSLVRDSERNRLVIREGNEIGSRFTEASMVFDPRVTFTYGTRQYWKYPELFSGWIEEGHEASTSIQLDQVTTPVKGIRFTCSTPPDINALVLDSASGWLPVELSTSGSWGSLELKVQYEEVNGIFVPLSYHRIQKDSVGIVSERLVEFTKHVLNEPIAEAQFTYEGLGVDDGTRVYDQIRGENFWLSNNELVPESAFVENANLKAEGEIQSSRLYLLYVNLAVLVIAFIFWAGKKLRGAKDDSGAIQ